MNSPRRLKVISLTEHKTKGNTIVVARDQNSSTELEFVTTTKEAPRHGQTLTLNISWESPK